MGERKQFSECSGRMQLPLSCDEIEPGLHLSGVDAAENEQVLRVLRITHIVTIDECPLKKPPSLEIQNLFIKADDKCDVDLLTHFPETNDFIQNGMEKGACLVHCFWGMSRSATVVIAYLMHKYQISFDEALREVRGKRCCICPNPGFVSQLRLYETMKWSLDLQNFQYRIYLLKNTANRVVKGKDLAAVEDYFNTINSVSCNTDILSQSTYKFTCKRCSHFLFDNHKLIYHFSGEDLMWNDLRWNYQPIEESKLCTKSLYVEPLPWMSDHVTEPRGEIICPECKSEVGCYSWAGLLCICEAAVCPAFRINENKVDRTLSH